jgi:hypothetical protein
MNIEFYLQIFEKSSNIKINENPSSGGTVLSLRTADTETDERTDGDIKRKTDRTRIITAFCSFVNEPKLLAYSPSYK